MKNKRFSCYAIFIGSQIEVYQTWAEVKTVKQDCDNPSYKGYYALKEVLFGVKAKLDLNFFINILLKTTGAVQVV